MVILAQKTLKQQAGDKPAGCIIQADDPGKIPFGFFVIPGTQIASGQPKTGQVLSGEDHDGVHQAAEKCIAAPQKTADGSEKGCHAIDRKHPDGCRSGEPEISSAESVERGEHDLKAPAEQTAVDKVVNESIHRKPLFYRK